MSERTYQTIEAQTVEGYPLHVVQVGSRDWFCAIDEPDAQPVVILGVTTSSAKRAEQRCHALWASVREGAA